MKVYLLEHSRPRGDGEESVKTIGIYSTRKSAEEAIERALALQGFCEYPDGFVVDEYVLDEDHWTSGFGGKWPD